MVVTAFVFDDRPVSAGLHKIEYAHHLRHVRLCPGAQKDGGAVQTVLFAPFAEMQI